MPKLDYDKEYMKKPELQDFRKEIEKEQIIATRAKHKEGPFAIQKKRVFKVESDVEGNDGPQLLWGGFYIQLPGEAKFKFQPRILAHLLITQYGIVRAKETRKIFQYDKDTGNYNWVGVESIARLCCKDMNDYTIISFDEVQEALGYVHRTITLKEEL